MQFNSIEFLIFFPIVAFIYFDLPKKVKQYWLLAASYYFYMCWNVAYVLLLRYSTVVTFASGLALERTKRAKWKEVKCIHVKKGIVAVSVVLSLIVLFYYKYFNFAIESLNAFTSHIIKCMCVIAPVIAVCIFARNNLLSFADQETPYYAWNKEVCNTRQEKRYDVFIYYISGVHLDNMGLNVNYTDNSYKITMNNGSVYEWQLDLTKDLEVYIINI